MWGIYVLFSAAAQRKIAECKQIFKINLGYAPVT